MGESNNIKISQDSDGMLKSFLFKPKGSQLANQVIVGFNFGDTNTKYRNRINGRTYTDLNTYCFFLHNDNYSMLV